MANVMVFGFYPLTARLIGERLLKNGHTVIEKILADPHVEPSGLWATDLVILSAMANRRRGSRTDLEYMKAIKGGQLKVVGYEGPFSTHQREQLDDYFSLRVRSEIKRLRDYVDNL